jgi:hypothetical protein
LQHNNNMEETTMGGASNVPKGMGKGIGKGKAPSKGAVGAMAGGPKKGKGMMSIDKHPSKPKKA